ncbi:hypothetical protein, partial [Dialister hominis]|uniref:hypothetical protein n=1 Tax=Dialister hominis TaxID=2582419 RepID=UPI003AEF52EB
MQGVDPALEGEKGRRPVLTLLREEKVGIRLRKVSNKSKLSSFGDADKKLDQLTEVSGGQFMYSHEERLKAVKLHVDSGMGLKGIMRTL